MKALVSHQSHGVDDFLFRDSNDATHIGSQDGPRHFSNVHPAQEEKGGGGGINKIKNIREKLLFK